MGKEKEKLFKDPVHGYISVPVAYCNAFIDTPVFQRLRHIEQTSMRPLYPAAHHDRFIHSLGVYHLGRQAFAHLASGTTDDLLPPDRVDCLRNTFEIACLLHDCGHAPFSHTYENFYNHSEADKDEKRANEFLLGQVDEAFKNDFEALDSDPAPHETFSAGLLLDTYKNALTDSDIEWDPFLAARMITGCVHDLPENDYERVENHIISLLNGDAIDVDKLDYIVRDTWASGVKNTSIDLERLLSAIKLESHDGNIRLCYRKSAMSVLQSVVDSRNYLYEWVYNHHTVLYYSKLLDIALRKLAKELAHTGEPDYFWNTVFSTAPFKTPVDLYDNHRIYLPTDGDIIHLLKERADSSKYPEVKEFLSHKPSRYALWKTFAEFKAIFDAAGVKKSHYGKIRNNVPKALADLTDNVLFENDIFVLQALSKNAVFEEEAIHINIRDKPVSYTKIFGKEDQDAKRFFYVFVPNEFHDQKEEFIQRICELHP